MAMFHVMKGTHGHVSHNERHTWPCCSNVRHMWSCFVQCLYTHGDVSYTDWHTLWCFILSGCTSVNTRPDEQTCGFGHIALIHHIDNHLSVCSSLFFALLLFIYGTLPSLCKDDKYWWKIFFILCVSYSEMYTPFWEPHLFPFFSERAGRLCSFGPNRPLL